jgi:hypothetical protein
MEKRQKQEKHYSQYNVRVILQLLHQWAHKMGCLDGCTTGEYKTVQYGGYTFDCQSIAEILGKHHTTAMAGWKQKWLRTTYYRFNIQMICGRIETKHKDIKDATERKETIKQEYEDFLEDYECIVFGH